MKEINEYINVDENTKKISFKKNESKENSEKFNIEKINFIIDKFMSRDDIYKFLLKYLKYRKDNWEDIRNHIAQQYIDFKDYIKNRIIMTIENENEN